ncbi:MAG: signal recognition particle protein [Corallococcus sp.]|nr:signal recognition particle protein [Corallococcus sp.]MCM1359467.1 signal recognition particle protein [Corallococcus sp.]MCM1394721.1 signal recognition particle protein [Corallococcus sp.]
MAAFQNFTDRINHIFSKLKNKGALSELEIKQAMREVRVALLEADVNFAVAKDFINKVTEKAVGEEILKSLTPGQQVIKIVNEQLVELLGSTQSKLGVSPKLPTIIMMCGLQGAGKTTMCGKLALYLQKQGKKVLLCADDVYRPAAIKQLQIVAEKVKAGFFEMGQGNPTKIAEHAVKHAEKNGFDTVIIDTAGRLHINEELMDELKSIKKAVNVYETLLVVDSMTGQDAVNVAKTFDEQLSLTGVIMTKLDGDTRGGATMSIKAVTGKPIKFCGTGEKPEDIEPFYPDRMASRILGMGDVLTLIEKAQTAIDEEQALKMAKKLKDATFDLNDYLEQFEQVAKMGDINDLVGMIPGANRLKLGDKKVDEAQIKRNKSIILSMTKEERTNPKLLNYSRRKRIAAGSGTQVQDVNRLIKQFEQTRDMMKKVAKNKRLPF